MPSGQPLLVRVRDKDPQAPLLEHVLFPLALSPESIWIGAAPNGKRQAQEAARAGFSLVDVPLGTPLPEGTQLVCSAASVWSAETLLALHAACADGAIRQAAIEAHTPLALANTRHTRALDGQPVPFDLFSGALEGQVPTATGGRLSIAGSAPLAVCNEDTATVIDVRPHGRKPHQLLMPQVKRLGGQLVHWLDVLELSLAALAHDLSRVDAHLRNSRIGDADIHPTATVIGSIVEDGARIEAHASVIGSSIGADVVVADHSVVVGSVLADSVRTLVDTSLRRVVSQPGATLSSLGLADSVVGSGAFVTSAVSVFSDLPGRDATVEGVDTKRAVLGVAVGARAVLGARALMVAGVALPAGSLVVARPGEAVGKFDPVSLEACHMRLGRRDQDL